MLASISPLGERARGNRWTITASAYALASTGAGALLGAALGGVVALVGLGARARLAVLAAAAVGAALLDAGLPGRLPGWHRQVDEDWLPRYRGWVYATGYGAQLGVGVVTVVTTATVYAWLIGLAATGSAGAGALAGAAFGLARAVPLLAVRRAETPAALRSALGRLSAWAPAGRRVAVVASLTIGVGAIGWAAR